jgi:hypothetical protein
MLRSLAHHPSYRRGREGGKEHDKSNEQELTDPKKKKKFQSQKLIVAIFEDTKQKYDAPVKSVRTALVKRYSMFQIGHKI